MLSKQLLSLVLLFSLTLALYSQDPEQDKSLTDKFKIVKDHHIREYLQ